MASENLDALQRARHAAEVFEGDRNRGERLFKMLLSERPRDGGVHFYYGLALEHAGDLRHALEHYGLAETHCWVAN